MIARTLTAVLAAVLMLSAAGCGPPVLDVKKDATVMPAEPYEVELPAVNKPQTVTVKYGSSGGKVNVYFFKAADVPNLSASVPASKALKSATGETSGSFTVDVPANTSTKVVVEAVEKKATVTLHLTNKK